MPEQYEKDKLDEILLETEVIFNTYEIPRVSEEVLSKFIDKNDKENNNNFHLHYMQMIDEKGVFKHNGEYYVEQDGIIFHYQKIRNRFTLVSSFVFHRGFRYYYNISDKLIATEAIMSAHKIGEKTSKDIYSKGGKKLYEHCNN